MSSGVMLKPCSLNWVRKLKNGQVAGFRSFCLMRCGFFIDHIHLPIQTKERSHLSANGWNNTGSNHERNDG